MGTCYMLVDEEGKNTHDIGKWAVRWAYPGSPDKAGELDKRWAARRKAITVNQADHRSPV